MRFAREMEESAQSLKISDLYGNYFTRLYIDLYH